jgi:hypothetical protein
VGRSLFDHYRRGFPPFLRHHLLKNGFGPFSLPRRKTRYAPAA